MAKTYSQKPSEIERRWLLIDASTAPVGRIATQIATYLTGKYKYYRHTGFPGGIKDASVAEVREKFPERIIEAAVRGMLPKNKLQAERMKRLRVFAGAEHTHTAQTPEQVELK